MYSIFALVLGVSQIAALMAFPRLSRYFQRRTLYSLAMDLILSGYVLFYFAPINMLFIGVAGILLFMVQAMMQLLMLVFLADTMEYGQWKLGKRSETVSFAIQPFINKIGGAIGNSLVGYVLVLSGLNGIYEAAQATPVMIKMMKLTMMF